MWNPAPKNYGYSANTMSSGGVPSVKPKWLIEKLGRNDSFLGMMVGKNDSVYICSRGDTYSLNSDTGEINWKSEVGNRRSTHRGMAVIKNYLLSNWKLYDCISGKLLFDYENSIDKTLKHFSWTWIIGNKFIKQMSPDSEALTTFDPESKEISEIESNLSFVQCGHSKVYGWTKELNFSCYMTDQKIKLWSQNLEQNSRSIFSKATFEQLMPFTYITNDSIFLIASSNNESYIICLSKESGEIKWELDSNSKSIDLIGNISRISVSDDYVYFTILENYNQSYVAINSKNGTLKWRVISDCSKVITNSPLISGDLIFHGKVVDRESNTQLFAMDRYTGKTVWLADDFQRSTHGLIGFQNKIIYTNTFSEIRCFEWTKEYVSAFRDREAPKLVSNNKKKVNWFNRILNK